jgi:hypothetical protein
LFSYKVLVGGKPCVHDCNGQNYRRATARDLELLENKTAVSPITCQKALLARHGFGSWERRYDEIMMQHARHKVLGDDEASSPDRKH